jgi:hypothetical protein
MRWRPGLSALLCSGRRLSLRPGAKRWRTISLPFPELDSSSFILPPLLPLVLLDGGVPLGRVDLRDQVLVPLGDEHPGLLEGIDGGRFHPNLARIVGLRSRGGSRTRVCLHAPSLETGRGIGIDNLELKRKVRGEGGSFFSAPLITRCLTHPDQAARPVWDKRPVTAAVFYYLSERMLEGLPCSVVRWRISTWNSRGGERSLCWSSPSRSGKKRSFRATISV